jgi:hypothetical protein
LISEEIERRKKKRHTIFIDFKYDSPCINQSMSGKGAPTGAT